MSTTHHPISMKGANALLQSHYDALVSIPQNETWIARDVAIGEGVLTKLRDINAVHVVKRGDARRRYQLHPAFAARIEEFEPKSPQLPCSHHGYHNIVGGDGYLCAYEKCGVRFDRATIEEVCEGE